MTINEEIKEEKVQRDINKATAKISELASSKWINMNIWLVETY